MPYGISHSSKMIHSNAWSQGVKSEAISHTMQVDEVHTASYDDRNFLAHCLKYTTIRKYKLSWYFLNSADDIVSFLYLSSDFVNMSKFLQQLCSTIPGKSCSLAQLYNRVKLQGKQRWRWYGHWFLRWYSGAKYSNHIWKMKQPTDSLKKQGP